MHTFYTDTDSRKIKTGFPLQQEIFWSANEKVLQNIHYDTHKHTHTHTYIYTYILRLETSVIRKHIADVKLHGHNQNCLYPILNAFRCNGDKEVL
jgi:hypothetical protein